MTQGLSSAAAAERLRADGPNELPTLRSVPLWRQLAAQMFHRWRVLRAGGTGRPAPARRIPVRDRGRGLALALLAFPAVLAADWLAKRARNFGSAVAFSRVKS